MKTLDPGEYHTDKKLLTHYLRNYERVFEPWCDKPVALLELGVYRGGSLKMWSDYFRDSTLVGLDMGRVEVDDPTGQIRTFQGEQQNTRLLDEIAAQCAPDGFDIIIDDCSHVGAPTRASFWHLFPRHLKPGGVYVIEDWGTGYWPMYPDGDRLRQRQPLRGRLADGIASIRYGRTLSANVDRVLNKLQREAYPHRLRSHDHGMAGFVKQLVDECGIGDATLPGYGIEPARTSMIRSMEVLHGHVFVHKAIDDTPMPAGRFDINRKT